MLWLALALFYVFVLAPILLFVGFVYCFTVKRALDNKIKVPRVMVWIARALLGPGAVSDATFNVGWGRLLFRERAQHGVMFTSRVQWHLDNSDGWRLDHAMMWATLGNFIYPGHFKVGRRQKG